MAVTPPAVQVILKRGAMWHYSVAVITWDSEGGSQNPGSIPGSAFPTFEEICFPLAHVRLVCLSYSYPVVHHRCDHSTLVCLRLLVSFS